MKHLKTLAVVVLSLAFTLPAVASDLEDAEGALTAATNSLQKLYDDSVIAFKLAEGETTYLRNMAALNKALAALAKAKAAGATCGATKLDQVVDDIKAVQKILSSYFGSKDMFAYDLRKDGISFQLDASVAGRLAKKLPFLGGASVGGSFRVNPGSQVVNQFNALKAEFYGLLVEAAALGPSDTRVKALAEWGNQTKVRYPGGSSFGEEIVTTQQLWNLSLR